MPSEYNKSHMQGILRKYGKNTTLHNFVLFFRRSHFKNSCFGFHQVSKCLKTIKPLELRPRCFKLMFSRVWKPDETLALVIEIVLLAAKCKYFHLSLDRRNMVLVNVICKTKMFVQNEIDVCRIASSRRSDSGSDPPRDGSKKRARRWSRE